MNRYKVTMRSVNLTAAGETATLEAVDYVGDDILDAYVADARTRWQHVSVSEQPEEPPVGRGRSSAAAAEYKVPEHLVGKTAADFARYGDASTPENALDEHMSKKG